MLFALLASEKLAGAPLRVLAREAGVSKGAAADMLERLEHEGHLGRRQAGRERPHHRGAGRPVEVVASGHHRRKELAAQGQASGGRPSRYPTPRTVSITLGLRGSRSILRRRFFTWESIVRS